MDYLAAREQYVQALKKGQKEYKERETAGLPPYPAVLDEILENLSALPTVDVGLTEIPAEKIVGTRSAGRIAAFTAGFRPLLKTESEFAQKWVNLCAAHMGTVGIRDPISCYEYLGEFYVEEGNKRVSVLRHFEASRIPANVRRIIPARSDDPRIIAYYEFLDYYKNTKLYIPQFRRPGDYAKFLQFVGKTEDEVWTEAERRTLNAYFQYFLDAFHSVNTKPTGTLPEEALLLWLEVYPYEKLGSMTASELKKSLTALWPDVVSGTKGSQVLVDAQPVAEVKTGILSKIITPDPLRVAFVHQLNPASSAWVLGHEDGRKYIEEVFGDKIAVRSYFNANTKEDAEAILEQAASDGAQVIFTTAPKLSRATLKLAVQYPKIKCFNCSVDQPFSSVRTYYGRIYEAKFITGAIAGAMAQSDRIGYIGSNPIFGVPASINAFALGAKMTNPRAQIELRWSCLEGAPQADFLQGGIRVISNRDVPTQDKMYLEFCNYGTYLLGEMGKLIPLASPVWVWGKFYEYAISAILSGTWKENKGEALNYWLGMDSGVIDIKLSDKLPEGVRVLADLLRRDLAEKRLDPFMRKITAQDGTLKNDGTKIFTPDELLHMDWLCDNVIGSIPTFDEVLPMSQSIVRELGIHRDKITAAKETGGSENSCSFR